jgi:hypothetical protein
MRTLEKEEEVSVGKEWEGVVEVRTGSESRTNPTQPLKQRLQRVGQRQTKPTSPLLLLPPFNHLAVLVCGLTSCLCP